LTGITASSATTSGSKPLVFTNGILREWQTCKRKYWLSAGLGYAPDPSKEPVTGVMHLGSAVHLALEAWYGYGIDPVSALRWTYGQDMLLYPGDEEELVKELTLAIVMTEGYCEWAAAEGVDVGVEIIGTEVMVEHETVIAGEPVVLRGKLDQLCRRKSDGALLARDLKTTGSLAKAQQLRFSSQLQFYALIQALEAKKAGKGELVTGGEYLLIVRSKRTSRASPPFYERVEVPLNRWNLASEWAKAESIIMEILEARKRLKSGEDHHRVVYAHQGDWCSYACSYNSVCPLFDDGSRAFDMLQAHYVKQDPLHYYDAGSDKMNLLRAALA
jgi:hypothetical protein